MRLILIISFTFFLVYSSSSQVYENRFLISIADSTLKEEVGERLFSYFQYDKNSNYQFQTKPGKDKWAKIKRKGATKGIFKFAAFKYNFQHPDFNYESVDKTIYVRLDSSLQLVDEPNIDFIPDFIKNNKPSNWLPEERIDEIIDSLEFTETNYVLKKKLEYNSIIKKYRWIVVNTLSISIFMTEVQYVEIDPCTGEVLRFEKLIHF